MATPAHDRQRELGAFVRAQREKLPPAAFGLPAAARRRTPGLRREEVAQLCGLSVTWYTWLEQGRDMSLSPAALVRLAKALRLGRAERAYLFELARKRDPDAGGDESDIVPPALLACVATIGSPAYILDRTWTARGWNGKAARLFAGWLDGDNDRNLLRYIFLEPAARADPRLRRASAPCRRRIPRRPQRAPRRSGHPRSRRRPAPAQRRVRPHLGHARRPRPRRRRAHVQSSARRSRALRAGHPQSREPARSQADDPHPGSLPAPSRAAHHPRTGADTLSPGTSGSRPHAGPNRAKEKSHERRRLQRQHPQVPQDARRHGPARDREGGAPGDRRRTHQGRRDVARQGDGVDPGRRAELAGRRRDRAAEALRSAAAGCPRSAR